MTQMKHTIKIFHIAANPCFGFPSDDKLSILVSRNASVAIASPPPSLYANAAKKSKSFYFLPKHLVQVEMKIYVQK